MSVSKPLFSTITRPYSCDKLIHPWNASCAKSAIIVMWESSYATAKFFTAVSLLQLLIRRGRDRKKIFLSFIGATLHGAYIGFSFVFFNCMFRFLFGKFNYYAVGLGSGILSGLGVFIEHPSRKNLLLNTYLNMVLEIGVLRLKSKGYLTNKRSVGLLLIFMTLNSLLLFKLQHPSTRNAFWFFFPPKQEDHKNLSNQIKHTACKHKGTCWEDTAKGAGCYFMLGLSLQFVKDLFFAHKIRKPNWQSLQLATFAGSYVAIFKAVTCFLRQNYKVDSTLHALPAGFLSGFSFIFCPKLNFLLAALGNLLQIAGAQIKESYNLPLLPYKELSFALCNGILYHHRILHADMCPKFFIFIIETMSNYKAAVIYSTFRQVLNKYFSSPCQ